MDEKWDLYKVETITITDFKVS